MEPKINKRAAGAAFGSNRRVAARAHSGKMSGPFRAFAVFGLATVFAEPSPPPPSSFALGGWTVAGEQGRLAYPPFPEAALEAALPRNDCRDNACVGAASVQVATSTPRAVTPSALRTPDCSLQQAGCLRLPQVVPPPPGLVIDVVKSSFTLVDDGPPAPENVYPKRPTVGWCDFNGDGAIDLFLEELYINDGSGNFAAVGDGPTGAIAACGDADGDNDLDLYAGGHLWLNDGDGTSFTEAAGFTEATGGPTGYTEGDGSAWGDVDNDSDLDLFAAGHLWLNNGDGTFTEAEDGPTGQKVACFADADGNGFIDLYIGGSELYLNNGDSTFTAVTLTLSREYPYGMMTSAAAWGDVDGDGDQACFGCVGPSPSPSPLTLT